MPAWALPEHSLWRSFTSAGACALRPLFLVAAVALGGCDSFTSHLAGVDAGLYLPLEVNIRYDPSVTEATLQYSDACRQTQTLPVGDRLAKALTRDIGQVFGRVRVIKPADLSQAPDGDVAVGLGFSETTLFIASKTRNTYPAVITLGATAVFTTPAGDELFRRSIRVEIRGDVDTDGRSCEVSGIPKLADQAAGGLAQGILNYMTLAIPLQRFAGEPPEIRRRGAGSPATRAPAPLEPSAPSLKWQARLMDESGDHVLQAGERVTLEIDVVNEGQGTAQAVAFVVTGPPIWAEPFVSPIVVGDVPPGTDKRTRVTRTVKAFTVPQQAEVTLALSTPSLTGAGAQEKTFVVSLRPGGDRPDEALRDVDVIPAEVAGYVRKKTAGIAIGVDTFRDPSFTGPKFASRDATTVARYWRTLGGLPEGHIKVLTNDGAGKDQWIDALEAWLPGRVEPGGTVFLYIAGRMVVDTKSGAPSFVTYDAGTESQSGLISLRRLHATLARLQLQQALIVLDVSLAGENAGKPGAAGEPSWEVTGPASSAEVIVQIAGTTGRQRSHELDGMRHGLFTYWWLQGLGGAADTDRNGYVGLGELYEFVRKKVPESALQQDGAAQVPVMAPPLEKSQAVWTLPLARVR